MYGKSFVHTTSIGFMNTLVSIISNLYVQEKGVRPTISICFATSPSLFSYLIHFGSTNALDLKLLMAFWRP